MFQLKTIQQKQHQLFQRISGKLKADLNLENLQKHLKLQYGLGCKFSSINSLQTSKKKHSHLLISDKTLISELVSHYSSLGVNIQVFNQDGQSIPLSLALADAAEYVFVADEEYAFESLINSLESISKQSNYSDIEWIKRILLQAYKKALNESQQDRVKQKLEEIFSANERFLKADYDQVMSRM